MNITIAVILLFFFFITFRTFEKCWVPPAAIFVISYFISIYARAWFFREYKHSFVLAYYNLNKSVYLGTLCLGAMFLGYLFFYITRRGARFPNQLIMYGLPSERLLKLVSGLAFLLLSISIMGLIVNYDPNVIQGHDAYAKMNEMSVGSKLMLTVRRLINPLLLYLILGVSFTNSSLLKRRTIVLILVVLTSTLLSFNRSAAVEVIFCSSVLMHYRFKKVKVRHVVIILVIFSALQFMRQFRMYGGVSNLNLVFVKDMLENTELFPFLLSMLLGLAGLEVFTNVLDLVPEVDDFKYGSTYLTSIVSLLIPRVFMPVSLTPETPSEWFQRLYAPLTTNHGFDFSLLAEAYMNFGNYMSVFFFFFGYVLAFISRKIRLTNSFAWLFFSIVCLKTLVFSVRYDSNVICKSIIYGTIPILVFFHLIEEFFGWRRTENKG